MKTAVALVLSLVAVGRASGPPGSRLFDTEFDRLRAARRAMSQMKQGTEREEVLRLLRFRTSEAIVMEGEPGYTLEMYFVDEQHRLFLSFEPNNRRQRVLSLAEFYGDNHQLIARIG